MPYYKRSIVIQAGSHAICVTEPSFENRKHDYTIGFYLNEPAMSEPSRDSLGFITAFRGTYLEDEIATHLLSSFDNTSFEIIPAREIPSSKQDVELLKSYDCNLGVKTLAFFSYAIDGVLHYGGYIKETSRYRKTDENEVLLNMEFGNAFKLPNSIGQLVSKLNK